MNLKKPLACVFTLLCLLLIDGCVTFQPITLVRYDEPADSFHIFALIEKIQFEHDSEAQGFSELWNNRHQWIAIPLESNLWDVSVLRVGEHQLASLAMGSQASDPVEVPVALSQISIQPGEFFVTKQSGLSYYHSYSLPGKLLDTVVETLLEKVTPEFQNWARTELLSDKPRLTWGHVRLALSDPNHKKRGGRSNVNSQDSRSPFCDESLQALADKRISFQRSGSELTFRIPMAKSDQLECIKSFGVYRKSQRKSIDASLSYVAVILRSATLAESADALIVSVDLSNPVLESDRFGQPADAQGLAGLPQFPDDLDRKYMSLKESIKKLKTLGVPVRHDLRIATEVAKWNR